MSKISNKAAYPAIAPVLTDYFVLTDNDSNLATKTCTLTALSNLFQVEFNNVTIAISAAQLKALTGTPITLIAAPGAGKVIDVLSVFTFLDAGVTAYDFPNSVSVKQGAASWATLSTPFLNTVADKAQHMSSDDVNCEINTSVTLVNAGVNATVGDGILKVNLRYRVLTLSTF
tara:strand:+ start:885 stop:1403 length:519 start_codon:yes stop_codon:yes gene_type:complete